MNLETMVYYLIIVNIVGFLVYFLNYMLRTHTKGKQINILIYLISLAGGAAGMLAAVLLFDRKAVKENMMSRIFVACIFVIQIILLLIVKGNLADHITFSFWDFFKRNKILSFYLIVINIVTFAAFAMDKIAAIEHRSRIRIVTLLGLSFAGGSIGAWLAMYLFRHKTRKDYFTVGVPLTLVMHIMIIFFLMNTK